MSIIPRGYAVELKDLYGTRIAYIDNMLASLSWEWNRIGGCGKCKLSLKEEFDGTVASSFAEDYEVNVYVPDVSGTSALWYSGYIDKVKPKVSGGGESININVLGYVNQLKRVVVNEKNYAGGEVSNTVRNIAEVYATGITSIISDGTNYEDSGFSADEIYFDENAYSSIKKLADIVGRREWGVNANKELFFKKRNDNTTHYYNITEHFSSFTPSQDFNPIITKIFLKGKKGYNAIFQVTNKTTTREKIVQNSSITTQSVGQRFARMYLKDKGRIRRSYKATLVENVERIETTVPIGRASVNVIRGIRDKYDIAANLYDSGIKYDGGQESYQINKIKYTLQDDKLTTQITFGVLPPNIVDDISQLEYQLTNERNI